ncbi:MAG: hypothetical protein HUU20_01555 [Pirellulales bacterium]|nr:hypothetical protein [Pirellulales bacterium]
MLFPLARDPSIQIERLDNAASFQNRRTAAGLAEGKFSGNDWSDGDCYKLLEAAAAVFAPDGRSGTGSEDGPVDRGDRQSPGPGRLIPYYAWANRGPSEMTVWIPLANDGSVD